jgi:hypothetical protein
MIIFPKVLALEEKGNAECGHIIIIREVKQNVPLTSWPEREKGNAECS